MIFVTQKKLRKFIEDELKRRIEQGGDSYVEEELEKEQERRKWCVDQATFLDNMQINNLLAAANLIYDYVYGKNEAHHTS